MLDENVFNEDFYLANGWSLRLQIWGIELTKEWEKKKCTSGWFIKVYSLTVLYTSDGDVTTVGQKEVTPCSNSPLATRLTPAGISPSISEKSTPNAPGQTKCL